MQYWKVWLLLHNDIDTFGEGYQFAIIHTVTYLMKPRECHLSGAILEWNYPESSFYPTHFLGITLNPKPRQKV